MSFAWIGDLTIKTNLQVLSKPLEKNEHFEVENNTIKIVKSEGFWDKVVYFFQEKRKNREVKALVKETIVHLANNLDGADKKEVKDLFIQQLSKLSKDIFDRRDLTDAGKLLPKILNPELERLAKTGDAKIDAQNKLERRIEKTKLALDLGIELKPIGKGASGSYFARDYKMKTIGVFKPGSEESTGLNTPKLEHRIKNLIGALLGISANSSFWPGSGFVSEKLTTVLADHLDIDVVPRAEITKLTSRKFVNKGEEEEGSYQIFSRDTKSADEMLKLNSMSSVFGNVWLKLNTWRYKDKIVKKISQSDFEKMAITDGLILNKDRHFENWLVKKEARKTPLRDAGTHEIVLIDNQMAFPKANPSVDHKFYRRQQNKWSILPQAEEKFSPEIKAKIGPSLRGKELEKLLANLQQASILDVNEEIKEFETRENGISQALAFKQRVAVLHYAFEQDISIRDYANLKSIEEMRQFTMAAIDLTDEAALDDYLGLSV